MRKREHCAKPKRTRLRQRLFKSSSGAGDRTEEHWSKQNIGAKRHPWAATLGALYRSIMSSLAVHFLRFNSRYCTALVGTLLRKAMREHSSENQGHRWCLSMSSLSADLPGEMERCLRNYMHARTQKRTKK